MRIVELGKYYPPLLGGMESYLEQVCVVLSRDHQVAAITFNDGPKTIDEVRDGVRVIRAGRVLNVCSQPIALNVGRHIRRFSPDLIHLHWPNPLAALLCATGLSDIPIVVTHHADITRQRLLRRTVLPIYRKLLQRAISVIVLSRKNAELSRDLGINVIRVNSIPFGVDATALAVTPEVELQMSHLRARITRARSVLGFVGRHVSYKGVDVLVRALVNLPGTFAIIAGDGPLRATWEKLAGELGVADRAIFLGRINNTMKAALYRVIDIFVLPSVSAAEAFGIVQVEAQLCGCPIIASSIASGVTEVTIHGETGLCVQPGCPDALAIAVERLAEEPQLRKQFGLAGYKRASALYSIGSVEAKLRDHFRWVEGKLNCNVMETAVAETFGGARIKPG